jgi:hypothetical protein
MTDVVMTPVRSKRRNGEAPTPVLVTGVRLATHFGVVRQHIDQLVEQGVIERRPDGLFDQDACRLKYFTHLRSERKRSPRTAADVDHVKAKTALMQLRLMERRRDLVRRVDVNELLDVIAGTVLTHLSGMGARCSRDLAIRRDIDEAVRQIRREISEACSRMADERGEPPLDQQPGWHDR